MKDALFDFPFVFVLPTPHEHFFINDDSQHLQAALQGVEEKDMEQYQSDNIGCSIAHVYYLKSKCSPLIFEEY